MDLKNLDFQDILGFGPKNYVGIDIGLCSVKVCELSFNPARRKNYKLVRYESIDLPEGCLIEDDIQRPDAIINAINDAISAANIKNKKVCIGISGPNTMSKRLQLPGGSKDDIEDQVMWESEQFIPFGIEDSTVSFHVIGENAGGGIDVLIAAARKDTVEGFTSIIDECQLKINVVDLDIFAMINVFEFTHQDMLKKTESSFIIIDFGAQKTNLVIYKNNSIVFTREMNIGGILVTEEIQKTLGLSYYEAELLKIKGDDQGNLPEDLVEIIDHVLDSFFSEVKKTLNFYTTASSDDSISKCYVCGGSSLIPGFIEGLEASLGINISPLNPFEKFEYDEKKFSADKIQEIAFKGVVAIGLAMRGKK